MPATAATRAAEIKSKKQEIAIETKHQKTMNALNEQMNKLTVKKSPKSSNPVSKKSAYVMDETLLKIVQKNMASTMSSKTLDSDRDAFAAYLAGNSILANLRQIITDLGYSYDNSMTKSVLADKIASIIQV